MKIGLTADMHSMAEDASDIPEAMISAFAGVDHIVACGDHVTGAALDRLAQLAPLTATANPNADGDGEGRAAKIVAVVNAENRKLGVLFSPRQLDADVTEEGEIIWPDGLAGTAERVFGQRVDGIFFGGTHTPLVTEVDALVLVNPGSPRFAHRTTAAIIDVTPEGAMTAEIIDV